MKHIKEYLENVIKVNPLGQLSTREDILNDMSGEMVYIDGKCTDIFISHADYANWLESKDEQKPFNYECASFQQKDFAPNEEPKFNIGDWIVSDLEDVNKDFRLCKIIGVGGGCYTIQSANGCKGYNFFETWESDYHLWSIADAKEGDVLVASDESLFIFAKVKDNSAYYHYSLCKNGSQEISDGKHSWETASGSRPATKEQRDILFQKMHEAGYEWDAEKKELKKIEQKSAIGDIDKMIDDYANNKERGNEEFGKPVPCMIRAYKQGLEDAVSTFNLSEQNLAWSEEDESMYTRTLGILGKCYMGELPTKVEEELNWFKSLKLPKRQKLSSELDEASYRVGIKRVLENPESYGLTKYNWKPSNDQLYILNWLANVKLGDSVVEQEVSKHLNELYKDLKKLREE